MIEEKGESKREVRDLRRVLEIKGKNHVKIKTEVEETLKQINTIDDERNIKDGKEEYFKTQK